MTEYTKQLETLSYRPKCETCGDTGTKVVHNGFGAVIHQASGACPDCKNEQTNQNLKIIEEIEGLMSKVNDKLTKLRPDTKGERNYQKQAGHKSRALEEIDLFQKTTLFDLRKLFE